MMILDAIRSAPTRHAVYFLVTAYIESLRHFERSCGAPAEVLELPVRGREDLAERTLVLHRSPAIALEAIVAMSELAAVLAVALDRLGTLEDAEPGALKPHARNDNRRSALSV